MSTRVALVVAAALAAGVVGAAAPARWRARAGLDVNGDGYADAVAGATLYFGGPGGLDRARAAVLAPPGGHVGLFGVVAPAGDVDGDGFGDLLVGDPACGDVALSMPMCGVGHAYLFRGGAGGPAATPVSALAAPGGANTHFGMTMTPAGDVDRDGHADVLILEVGAVVWLYAGAADGLSRPPVRLPVPPLPPGLTGSGVRYAVVAGGGDVDGDGFGDVAVSGPGLGVVRGGPGGLAAGGPVVLSLPASPMAQATALALGDFDADGFADVAAGLYEDPIGADSAPGPGRVYVFRGGKGGPARKPTTVLTGVDRPRGGFGSALAALGDVDGDAFGDLGVVASCAAYDAHRASCDGMRTYLFRGGAHGLAKKAFAVLPPGRAAMALVALGDVDADGFADFLSGAFFVRGARKGLAAAPTGPL
jgi:hypothetical protein